MVQLQRFVATLAAYHENCYEVMKKATIFPLEMDLSRDAFAYKSEIINTGEDEDAEDVEPLDTSAAAEGIEEKMESLLDLGSDKPPGDAEPTPTTPQPTLFEGNKDIFDLISID